MIEDFDTNADRLDEAIDVLLSRMKQTQKKFVSATVQFLVSWFQEELNTHLRRRPAWASKLASEGRLLRLEAEVKVLQEETLRIVAEILNDPSLWYRKRQSPTFYEHRDGNPPPLHAHAIRSIAGKLGPILERYGFISLDPRSHDFEQWRETRRGVPARQSVAAGLYYPYPLRWSPQMQEYIEEYKLLYSHVEVLDAKLNQIGKEKGSMVAQDLWYKL